MDTADLINTRIEYIRFTNNLPFAFTDRYDGVPFIVAPGRSENLPPEVAAHFFGYDPNPEAQMRHVAKRQGWNTPEFVKINEATGKSKAQDYFDALTIKPIAFKLVPVEDGLDPREPIPADPVQAAAAIGDSFIEESGKPASKPKRRRGQQQTA